MAEQSIQMEQDNLNIYKRRIEIMVGARLRENAAVNKAIEIQDRLREKIGKWQGSEEIKKWRMIS